LVVHKPPQISDYYESRHLLPAIFPITLFYIGLINLISGYFLRGSVRISHFIKSALLAYFLALNIGAAQMAGLKLWGDWERQVGIMDYIKKNQSLFDNVNTFIFVDKSKNSRSGDRHIWAYEYTGNLLKVYGKQDKLGVGIEDYRGWEKEIILLNSEFYKKRYNLSYYNFNGKHAIIYIFNRELRSPIANWLTFAYEYTFGIPYGKTIEKKFLFEHAFEYVVVDKRIPVILDIRDALAKYKDKYGYFPSRIKGPYGVNLSGKSDALFDKYINYIPGIFPEFMAAPFDLNSEDKNVDLDNRSKITYMSNGLDYKLIYSDPLDLPYAKQAFPGFIDANGAGYGIWTKGAIHW
jgi:hypothetical protein